MQASASFLKKRSKKLLSVAPCGNAAISRRARAKPTRPCDRATVGGVRKGDGLRRKEGRGNDEWGKFFGSLFFKKGTACFLAGPSVRRCPGKKFGMRAMFFLRPL
jgi:hypothetical protein